MKHLIIFTSYIIQYNWIFVLLKSLSLRSLFMTWKRHIFNVFVRISLICNEKWHTYKIEFNCENVFKVLFL